MIDLILTMIVALDDVGGLFLQFTQTDIDNLIKKYNVLEKIRCNERGLIILWQKKYITNEQFARYMDMEYDEESFWLVADDFGDILNEREYQTEVDALNGELDWEPSFYSNYTAGDISYQWKDFNEKTLKAIIKFCIRKELEIDGILMTEDNTVFQKGDVYFNDTRLIDYLDDDDLDELRTSLSISISESQDSADRGEMYDLISDAFEEQIGPFKHKTIKDYNGKEKTKVFIKLSNIDFDEISEWLKDQYNEYDFMDENYGSMYSILREREYFEFKTPNYDYLSGDIDEGTLNEYTQNRLDWD